MTRRPILTLTILTCMFVLGCTTGAKPNIGTAPDFLASYNKASHLLNVLVKLPAGVHAYAPGETVGKPVNVVVKPENGWKISSVHIPKGKEKTLPSSGKSMILEGDFNITAKVEGGRGPILGELHLQVCSDDACDRPRVHQFTVDVN